MNKMRMIFGVVVSTIAIAASALNADAVKSAFESVNTSFGSCPTSQNLIDIIGPELEISSCYKGPFSNLEQATLLFQKKNSSHPVPVNALYISDHPIRRIILSIHGGPGETGLVIPSREFADGGYLWEFARKCEAVVLDIEYSGSFTRSLYPDSSLSLAVSEISELLSYTKKQSVEVNVIATSLGAWLYAQSPEKSSGSDVFIAPLLHSPKKIPGLYQEASLDDEHVARRLKSTKSRYYVRKGDKVLLEYINTRDYNLRFFGDNEDILNTDLFEFLKRTNYNRLSKDKFAIIGERDRRAGSLEFTRSLVEYGFDISIIHSSGHSVNRDNSKLFEIHMKEVIEKICE